MATTTTRFLCLCTGESGVGGVALISRNPTLTSPHHMAWYVRQGNEKIHLMAVEIRWMKPLHLKVCKPTLPYPNRLP